MSIYPENNMYTENHAWARIDGNIAVIGITDYAQEQLGEVVYVDLPQLEDDVVSGEVMGSVESVKSISDIYSPVSGKIIEVNEPLIDEPGNINKDVYGEGWLVKIEMANPAEAETLLSAADYQAKLD